MIGPQNPKTVRRLAGNIQIPVPIEQVVDIILASALTKDLATFSLALVAASSCSQQPGEVRVIAKRVEVRLGDDQLAVGRLTGQGR